MAVDPNSPVIPNAADGPRQSRSEVHGGPVPGNGLQQASSAPSAGPAESSTAPVWMQRLNSLSFVLLCGTLGVLLIVVPWWPQWTDNYLLFRFPQLRGLVSSGFFRGVCSGFGVLDVWIGFWHAITYREDTPS